MKLQHYMATRRERKDRQPAVNSNVGNGNQNTTRVDRRDTFNETVQEKS